MSSVWYTGIWFWIDVDVGTNDNRNQLFWVVVYVLESTILAASALIPRYGIDPRRLLTICSGPYKRRPHDYNLVLGI
jgi:hypothetical protein